MRIATCVLLALGLVLPVRLSADESALSNRLIVHEWGTFTVLQDETGKPIGGINTDDEPVPSFVHDLHGMLVQGKSEMPHIYFKGWPRCDRDVLVRLETPVIYFHPPAGSGPIKLDVEVAFNGGWLTQFYPDAKADAPGLSDGGEIGPITNKTHGSLLWHDLVVGTSNAKPPETADKVWLAPRNVNAADVTNASGESERYVFYRGVGHLDAPLTVSRDATGKMLHIRATDGGAILAGRMWLLDVRADGNSAMRVIEQKSCRVPPTAQTPADFNDTDYSKATLATIRQELATALVIQGLYHDEADALLNTWEASYFKRPGLRLFFMVPPPWTQTVLPLKMSRSVDITRVMVGRIELITPRARELLAKIAAGPISNPRWVESAMKKANHGEDSYRETWYAQLMNGNKSLLEEKIEIPADYRAYLNLGRFRNALILDEAQHRPTPALTAFITSYELGASTNPTGKGLSD